MVDLPSAEHVAFVAVAVLAAIVAWDAYWLTKQRHTGHVRRCVGRVSLPPPDFSARSQALRHHVHPSFCGRPTVSVAPASFGKASAEAANHAAPQRVGAVWPTAAGGRRILAEHR